MILLSTSRRSGQSAKTLHRYIHMNIPQNTIDKMSELSIAPLCERGRAVLLSVVPLREESLRQRPSPRMVERLSQLHQERQE
jgi:hypothetical protein